jgi:hypothetical protein
MQEFGLDLLPLHYEDTTRPQWMLDQMGINWDDLTISCMPFFCVDKIPGNGKHWLYSMCESSLLAKRSAKMVKDAGVERMIVPCEHNKKAFQDSGIKIPIDVLPLGTDPDEFPLVVPDYKRPYTFLTLADRGFRKGWQEVYEAFYLAFGSKSTGDKDVRLVIKSIPKGNPLLDLIGRAEDMDPRISIDISIYPNVADFYRQGDCLALPSRCEGWGMPHREAAMMGLPVITQRYSGLDDGHTEEWSLVVGGGKLAQMPKIRGHEQGEWLIPNKYRLADAMRFCYDEPDKAEHIGKNARSWLSSHQTWQDAAAGMIELIHDKGGLDASSERRRANRYTVDQTWGTNGKVFVRSLPVGEIQSD